MAYEPTELTAPDGGRVVKVQFDDGTVKVFTHAAYNAMAGDEAALRAYQQPVGPADPDRDPDAGHSHAGDQGEAKPA